MATENRISLYHFLKNEFENMTGFRGLSEKPLAYFIHEYITGDMSSAIVDVLIYTSGDCYVRNKIDGKKLNVQIEHNLTENFASTVEKIIGECPQTPEIAFASQEDFFNAVDAYNEYKEKALDEALKSDEAIMWWWEDAK